MLDDEELSATEALGILVTEPSPASGRAMKDNTPGESSSEQVKVQSHANDDLTHLTHTAPQNTTLNLSLPPNVVDSSTNLSIIY